MNRSVRIDNNPPMGFKVEPPGPNNHPGVLEENSTIPLETKNQPY